MVPDQEVSEQLRRKLEDAKASYERARIEYQRLMNIATATVDYADPGRLDGKQALRQAIRIHAYARGQYERALTNFTDFVLQGKLPPPE